MLAAGGAENLVAVRTQHGCQDFEAHQIVVDNKKTTVASAVARHVKIRSLKIRSLETRLCLLSGNPANEMLAACLNRVEKRAKRETNFLKSSQVEQKRVASASLSEFP